MSEELVSGPVTVYLAPAGTAASEISATPGAPWAVLGVSGDENIAEDGLTVELSETVNAQRTLGTTGPRKFFRSEEDLMLSCTLLDLTAETFAKAMNNATVTDTAAASGTGGYRSFPLLRGQTVNTRAILVRGYSPYDNSAYNAQYWIPEGYVSLSGGPTYQKGEAGGLGIEIMVIEDETNGFGLYMAQDAAPI